MNQAFLFYLIEHIKEPDEVKTKCKTIKLRWLFFSHFHKNDTNTEIVFNLYITFL
jgi:hypothetical protein